MSDRATQDDQRDDQDPKAGTADGDDEQADRQKPDDMAELRTAMKAELAEVRKLRKELGKAPKDDAKADDLTRLRTEVEKLQGERRRDRVERQVIEAAEKAGATKATRILRMYRDELDIDDDGTIVNLADIIAQAKDDEPGWFGRRSSGSADGGAGSDRDHRPNDMNTQIRRAAGFRT